MGQMAATADPRNTGILAGEGSGISHTRETGLPEYQSSSRPSIRIAGYPDSHNTVFTDIRIDGDPAVQSNGSTVVRDAEGPDEWREGLVGAAERLAHIEQTRGPKRRFEYLIPARVGDALAEDAARQGKSATVRLLEVLRDAGYPVIPEDLIDLRKERRR